MSFETASNTESSEKIADWRTLQEQAPHQVEEDFDAIDEFRNLGPEEQNIELWGLLHRYQEEGNHNRFKGQFVANYIVANDELIAVQKKATNTNAAPGAQLEKAS